MRNWFGKWLGACAALLALQVSAATLDIYGVKVADSATVAGVSLQRNGAGTRFKGPFKVYVADLYATRQVDSLEALLAAPGPKRMTLTMLRDMDAGPFGKLLTRGMEDNNPKSAMSRLIPGLLAMGNIFSEIKTINTGDTITMDWIPDTGLVIYLRGKEQGEPFKEPEFYRALMAIWLGPVPADWKLKDALLGKK